MADPYSRTAALDLEHPPRTSAMAVISLVFGLLCCIPGVGLIAAILGGASLVRISQSEGELRGRGVAMAGTILGGLGLIWSLLVVALGIGVTQALSQLSVYADAVKAAQAGDIPAARSVLTPAANAAVSDEQLVKFGQDIAAEWGAYRGTPRGLLEWTSRYLELSSHIEPLSRRRTNAPASETALPLPISFDKGEALAIFYLDRHSPGPSGAAQAVNIVIEDRAGQPMWLIEKAPVPSTPSAPPATPAPGGEQPPSSPAEDAPETPGDR